MLASVVTKELNIQMDLTRLMEMLLIHDLGEVVIGDISDVEDDFAKKNEKEKEAVKDILSNLTADSANYYYGLWVEMERKETDLAKLAYSLDKLDAIIKAGIYEKEYDVKGLFDEFHSYRINDGTFNNNVLEDFFNFLKYDFYKDNIRNIK